MFIVFFTTASNVIFSTPQPQYYLIFCPPFSKTSDTVLCQGSVRFPVWGVCCLVINLQLLWFSNHESYCPLTAVICWLNQSSSHKQTGRFELFDIQHPCAICLNISNLVFSFYLGCYYNVFLFYSFYCFFHFIFKAWICPVSLAWHFALQHKTR